MPYQPMSLTPFMWIGESHRRSLLTSLCSGNSFFRTSPPIRNDFLFFPCIGIEGDTMLGWKAIHAFPRLSRSPQYWLVGRQVKCHPAGSQPCCGRRGCGSWHICPIPSPRSCLQKWRTCSRTTSYQRNGIVANGNSSLAYPRGPCFYDHTWQHMDSCLACNTLQVLDFAIVSFRGGLVLLSFYPFVLFLWPIACVYA